MHFTPPYHIPVIVTFQQATNLEAVILQLSDLQQQQEDMFQGGR